jgi:hypothetical protein
MSNLNTASASASAPSTTFGGVEVVNLNKHAIVLRLPSGEDVVFPPSGEVCSVAVKQEKVGEIGGVPIMGNVYGEVEGLYEPQEGVVFLVNAIVLSRIKGRSDCFAPDTGPTAIREGGQVKAVIRFVGC